MSTVEQARARFEDFEDFEKWFAASRGPWLGHVLAPGAGQGTPWSPATKRTRTREAVLCDIEPINEEQAAWFRYFQGIINTPDADVLDALAECRDHALRLHQTQLHYRAVRKLVRGFATIDVGVREAESVVAGWVPWDIELAAYRNNFAHELHDGIRKVGDMFHSFEELHRLRIERCQDDFDCAKNKLWLLCM